MSSAPLPQPADPIRIEAVAELLASVIEDKSAIYLSVPITSGRRFIEWFKARGVRLEPNSKEYKRELLQSVIHPNCEDVASRVAELRKITKAVVINPAAFNRPDWNQDDYRYFWGYIIERFVERVVFKDDWQFSSGCGYEFLRCIRSQIAACAENGKELRVKDGLTLIEQAIAEMRSVGAPTLFLERIHNELSGDLRRLSGETAALPTANAGQEKVDHIRERSHFKDEILNDLASVANVAQFVSFGPEGQRFSRIRGFSPNEVFPTANDAISALLENSPEGTVNVRSFFPEHPTGEPLIYGLTTVDAVIEVLSRKAARKLYTIVNETIDIEDGGVSGVALADVVEFAPCATPQSVDHPGICSLPRNLGLRVLQQVYGFRPALNYEPNARVEFSLHPRQRGLCSEHTIIWEIEHLEAVSFTPRIRWQNNFSRFLGEKVFGLLLADSVGLPVPRTTVITRRISPFTFGVETGTVETWMRTAPEIRAPGKYPTTYGWTDPFIIMKEHDRDPASSDPRIASILSQESVHAEFSGAAIPRKDGSLVIEGVSGRGDAFMLGEAEPVCLPKKVQQSVQDLFSSASRHFGPVELEWVYDGDSAWIVQIHPADVIASTDAVFPGEAESFIRFDVREGLDALRSLIPELVRRHQGVVLIGNVGITSHFGDVLRAARLPSRIEAYTHSM
jgi:hypothetical protein